jgi:hypothetical protein
VNVLFIQVEFDRFAASLPWTYWCHVGMAKALADAGHRVDVVLSCQPERMQQLAADGGYDLAIVNDVVHGFGSTDAAVYPLPTAPLRRLRERGVPLLGVLIETAFHGAGEAVHDVLHVVRKRAIEQAAVWLDFVISYDRFDVDVLRSWDVNALWTPFFSQAPALPEPAEPAAELVFYGAMYDKRRRFLADAGAEHLVRGGYVHYPPAYAQMFERLLHTLALPQTSPAESFELTRMFKASVFQLYAQHLLSHRLIVNLPAIFKGIACRVVESVAMGRPSLCPLPRHADERALLARLPGRACVLYDTEQPEAFTGLLQQASQIQLDDGERAALQQFFQQSPFAPARFAQHLAEFTGGARTAAAIEASYLS